MQVKTPVKKTVKAAKKPLKKASRGTSWESLRKAQEEAWEAIRDGQKEMREFRESLRESDMKFREALRESTLRSEKADQELRESTKEFRKSIDKSMGELSNKLGSIVEKIMIPDLPKKFNALGYSFTELSTFIISEGIYAQFDGLLENGTQAVAVEVKTTLRVDDINDHLLRMEKLCQHANKKGDTRQFMGAMAAIITDKSAKAYALKHGLFVIEPSGNNVKVTKPPKEPRVW
jgi:predicted nuclease with TOPRIM domain